MTFSILDIDLDYFNQIPDAVRRLEDLLAWAACPVSTVVERHNRAFTAWCGKWRRDGLEPTHILHVDEHHDMIDERRQPNIANFMVHAMRLWPACRVHWLVEHPIDSPAMWLADESWNSLRPRFSYGPRRSARWPKPELVTVCTSPDFIAPALSAELMNAITAFESTPTEDIRHESPRKEGQQEDATEVV